LEKGAKQQSIQIIANNTLNKDQVDEIMKYIFGI